MGTFPQTLKYTIILCFICIGTVVPVPGSIRGPPLVSYGSGQQARVWSGWTPHWPGAGICLFPAGGCQDTRWLWFSIWKTGKKSYVILSCMLLIISFQLYNTVAVSYCTCIWHLFFTFYNTALKTAFQATFCFSFATAHTFLGEKSNLTN